MIGVPLHIIIQMRMGSTRLPGKMVLPFNDSDVLADVILKKLKIGFPDYPVIVATTNQEQDDRLVDIIEKHNVEVFRGDENDVLGRFICAAEHYNAKRIVRVCADNPFLSVTLLKELIEKWDDSMDYLAHSVGGKPSMKTGLGFFAEMTTLKALKKAYASNSSKFYREHVTNYIYDHSDEFNINWIECPKVIVKNKDIRLTVDTIEDFEIAKDTFINTFGKDYSEIVDYVLGKGYVEGMIKISNENKK